jgi:leishmanolysin
LDFNNLSDGKWYKWIQTTIHEATHVLGFSSGLFPYYIDPNTNQKLGLSKIV